MEQITKTIAKINDVNIIMIENGNQLVPVKPICEILGVSHQKQIEKLKSDEILSSTVTLRVIVAADGKERKMTAIPLKYIFGWLFTINPKNVKPEAREAVIRYKSECYNALYDYFEGQSKFLKEKQEAMIKQQNKLDEIRTEFNNAKNRLKEEREKLKEITDFSFEEWRANNMQLKLFAD